jgi:hypothetical protein
VFIIEEDKLCSLKLGFNFMYSTYVTTFDDYVLYCTCKLRSTNDEMSQEFTVDTKLVMMQNHIANTVSQWTSWSAIDTIDRFT